MMQTFGDVMDSFMRWLGGRFARDVEIQKYRRRELVTKARHDYFKAELASRQDLAKMEIGVRLAEAELTFITGTLSAGSDEARRLITNNSETQRLLIERERIKREPLVPPTLPVPKSVSPPPVLIERSVTTNEIEQAALRAVRLAGGMLPQTVTVFWAEWRGRINKEYPSYVASEIIDRACELWDKSS